MKKVYIRDRVLNSINSKNKQMKEARDDPSTALSRNIYASVLVGNGAFSPKGQGDCRIEMTSRDVADGIDHHPHGTTRGEPIANCPCRSRL